MLNALITKTVFFSYNLSHQGKLFSLYRKVKQCIEGRERISTSKLTGYLNSWGFDKDITKAPVLTKEDIKHMPVNKVTVIPNMAKTDRFWPRGKNLGFDEHLELPKDSFKIIQFDTMGNVNGLDNFVEAASLSQKMDKNARVIAETEFDISILCPKYVALIDKVFSKMDKEG